MKVFLNYRRDDTSGYALSLYRDLVDRFGQGHVFMDIDAIAPGDNFVEQIQQRMSTCDVVVAVMGRQWLSMTDEDGVRRLDDPDDFVRLELEAALERSVPLIPTLVHGARVPDPDDLPESLRPVALRQAIELHDATWDADVARLLTASERLAKERGRLGATTERLRAGRRLATIPLPGVVRRRWRVLVGAAAALVAAVVALLLLLPGSSGTLGETGDIALLHGGVLSKMSADASGLEQLYPGQISSTGYGVGTASTFTVRPTWSPDRKHVAFAKDGDIWVLSPGGKARDITNTPSISEGEPAWSPDAKRIAFGAYSTSPTGCTNTCEKVYVMDPNGRHVKQLTPDGAWYDYLPAWSPDGKKIAFASNRSGKQEIWMMTAAGGEEHSLTEFRGDSLLPAWSPDGKQIAFETDASDPKYGTCGTDGSCVYDIAVLTVGSKKIPVRITHAPVGVSDVWPSWISANELLFTASSRTSQDIWKVNADGTGVRELTFDHQSAYTDVAR